jgi:hypothetical protein
VRRKFLYFRCHSGLDPESTLIKWIPAFAGMTALNKLSDHMKKSAGRTSRNEKKGLLIFA